MPHGEEPSITTPLLGGSRQTSRDPLYKNLFLGTYSENPILIDSNSLTPADYALLAQAGILLTFVVIWYHVLTHDIILFSGHPLFQSAAVLVLTQAILILQPTHTAEQKSAGQVAHAALNATSFLLLLAGVTIIEVNKFRGNGPHFHSVHGTLGILTSIAIVLQYFFGVTIWAYPGLFGGLGNAKALYKYHRVSGYFIYLAILATVFSAVWTDYNKNVLGIRWWQIAVPIALVLPVLLRINVAKFGFGAKQTPVEDHARRE